MPTPEAAEAVKVGCSSLQQRCQERISQSFGSCREFLSVLPSTGRTELLPADTIQKSTAELEAVHSRVNSTYKNLQKLHENFAAVDSQEVDALAACSPDGLDEADMAALMAFIADTEQLEELLQSLQQLKPQLDTQADAGHVSPEGEGSQWPVKGGLED
jgi:hypothetical protein